MPRRQRDCDNKVADRRLLGRPQTKGGEGEAPGQRWGDRGARTPDLRDHNLNRLPTSPSGMNRRADDLRFL
jgi:hypothetical protein